MKLFAVVSAVFFTWFLMGKVPAFSHTILFSLPGAGVSLSVGVLACLVVAWAIHSRVR